MKNIILKLLVFTLIISSLGCSKDSTSDCIPITCLNGGTSNSDCGCNCLQGYTGKNCSNQITPSKIIISKIRVKYFPNTDNGSTWDISLPSANNSYPDVYVSLSMLDTVIYNSTIYYTNVISDGSNNFDFVPSTPISITSVNSSFIINLFDYDGSDSNINDNVDDLMAYKVFNLYSSTGGFPSTLTIEDNSKPFAVELSLSYQW